MIRSATSDSGTSPVLRHLVGVGDLAGADSCVGVADFTTSIAGWNGCTNAASTSTTWMQWRVEQRAADARSRPRRRSSATSIVPWQAYVQTSGGSTRSRKSSWLPPSFDTSAGAVQSGVGRVGDVAELDVGEHVVGGDRTRCRRWSRRSCSRPCGRPARASSLTVFTRLIAGSSTRTSAVSVATYRLPSGSTRTDRGRVDVGGGGRLGQPDGPGALYVQVSAWPELAPSRRPLSLRSPPTNASGAHLSSIGPIRSSPTSPVLVDDERVGHVCRRRGRPRPTPSS